MTLHAKGKEDAAIGCYRLPIVHTIYVDYINCTYFSPNDENREAMCNSVNLARER